MVSDRSPAGPPPDPHSLMARAARGGMALGLRQGIVHALHLAAGLALARRLSPADFGVYALVVLCGGVLTTAGVAAVGTGLVRQPTAPDELDRRTAFTLQLALASTSAILLAMSAGWARDGGWLGAEPATLLALVAGAPVLASFALVPIARLERGMAFASLARIEVAQAAAFCAAAVGLSYAGMGIHAFGIALWIRVGVGVGLLMRSAAWRPRLAMDAARARAQLRFALPLLASVGVSLLRDGLTPALIGLIGGATAVGFITWAQALAVFPAWIPMILQRSYLPAFASVQTDRRALSALAERALQLAHALVAPLAVVVLVLVDPITRLLFGAQWLPALPLVALLWSANLVAPTATSLLGLTNAIGESHLALRMNAIWLACSWFLGLPLLWAWGPLGFAVANVLTQATNLILVAAARERVPMRIFAVIWPWWGWATAVGALVMAWEHARPTLGVWDLSVKFLVAMVIYLLGLVVAVGPGRAWQLMAPVRPGSEQP